SPDTTRAISSAEFFFASKRKRKSMRQRANCGKRRANESDATTHRTPKKLRSKSGRSAVPFRESFGVRTRPRVAFVILSCKLGRVLSTQYETSAGIWNAGLLTRTSFQSHGLPET